MALEYHQSALAVERPTLRVFYFCLPLPINSYLLYRILDTAVYIDYQSVMPLLKSASVAPRPPQQHKQPSRKGKKAWRKNVDVTEISQGLEEVREEVIKG